MENENEFFDWFGAEKPFGDLPPDEAIIALRELGDMTCADELAAAEYYDKPDVFGGPDFLSRSFSRFYRTIQVCGFLPARGSSLIAVSEVKPDVKLRECALRITLDGLHVANYPGYGVHNVLFDFAIQRQSGSGVNPIFHYNAKFQARDGETVPVRNFPIFYGLEPSAEGLTFGFQTVNVSSRFNEGLLKFLAKDEFKEGLSLVGGLSNAVGQVSCIASTLTGWLASNSKNRKVQEFHQGLELKERQAAGGLAEGTYIVAQIPKALESEWSWDSWRFDPALGRLTSKLDGERTLDFNHLMIGIQSM